MFFDRLFLEGDTIIAKSILFNNLIFLRIYKSAGGGGGDWQFFKPQINKRGVLMKARAWVWGGVEYIVEYTRSPLEEATPCYDLSTFCIALACASFLGVSAMEGRRPTVSTKCCMQNRALLINFDGL